MEPSTGFQPDVLILLVSSLIYVSSLCVSQINTSFLFFGKLLMPPYLYLCRFHVLTDHLILVTTGMDLMGGPASRSQLKKLLSDLLLVRSLH